MNDGERVALTPKQVRDGIILLVVAVLGVVLCGLVLRDPDREPAYGGPPPAVDPTVARRGAEILLGRSISTQDFGALDKSLGDPVRLRAQDSEVTVTPTGVTTGTDECASGPLTTVRLRVELTSGPAVLSLDDFTVLRSDGSAVPLIWRCMDGFDEDATERTMVFHADRPERLVVGTDPARPAAAWQLT